MKHLFTRALDAAFVAILAASFVSTGFGQAEKVKQKAKDLKKEVESGGKQATNKPPQAPKPGQSPQAPKPVQTPQTPQKPAPPKPAK